MTITFLQTSLHWEDRQKNLDDFEDKISAINDTDLILLPEMFTTGFTMNAAALAEPMDGPAVTWIKRIAKEKSCAIAGSLIIEEDGKYYNRMVWVHDGKVQHYDKRHLFSLAHEEKTYTAGTKKLIVELNGWKICPLICYDLRFPVWSRRTKAADYDILLYSANWPERRIKAWKTLLPARAVENQCYVIGVNRIGDDGTGIYHSGDSAAYDFRGELVSKTLVGEESVERAEFSLEELRDFRRDFGFAEDADGISL